MLADLVRENRSYRRFDESRAVSREQLLALADLARLTPSHRNAQELRFRLVHDEAERELVFPLLTFAAALGPAGRPARGQRPAAYIIMLGKSAEHDYFWADVGMAAQSMLLGAREQGLVGCIHCGVQREKLTAALQLPPELPILAVLSIGAPGEEIRLEQAAPGAPLKYWRDENGVHHVPKLALEDIII